MTIGRNTTVMDVCFSAIFFGVCIVVWLNPVKIFEAVKTVVKNMWDRRKAPAKGSIQSSNIQRFVPAEEAKTNTFQSCIDLMTEEDCARICSEINEQTLAQMKVGCLCGGSRPGCTQTGTTPCKRCGKPCTYQPTVYGRPLYRCEWAVLQKGPIGDKERHFRSQQLEWYWTCSVCGMEPLYKKSEN